MTIDKSVTIRRPVGEVYRYYRDFSRLPEFLGDVMAVEALGPTTYRWTIHGPFGLRVCATVNVVNEVSDAHLRYEMAAVPGLTTTWERRRRLQDGRDRIAELLPVAARLGVPVLAGTDVTGSIPREVALLSRMGLGAGQALAAASVWPRRFLRAGEPVADIVTYHHDPREDPDQLEQPAAVVVGGTRVR